MQTVIWDFNGTIIDDVQLCLNIENAMLEERHMKHGYTLEQYRSWFCFPVIKYYYKLGYTFDQGETYEHVSEEFNEMYDRWFDTVKLMPGFKEKIRESIKKGYQNIILSASEQNHLNEQCAKLHIDQYFQEIIGTSDLLAYGKIDRARRWLNQAQVNPDDCIYIGDTVHDLETAQALNINHCVLIAQGHQSLEVLHEHTDQAVNTLMEVRL
ncbi:MAG: HAD hydrolase-like protein [Solobacterium sp.]|jgi:phosphoglycolate phosphatase|nr:HAD hydrolase-like protein [Solobacterium sp.]MCH4223098.1 HAD hydrolase-like protein [Solobacterium sp.]MCH4265083.1 HAD hydrolase-like protein [Solobacterium sp.]